MSGRLLSAFGYKIRAIHEAFEAIKLSSNTMGYSISKGRSMIKRKPTNIRMAKDLVRNKHIYNLQLFNDACGCSRTNKKQNFKKAGLNSFLVSVRSGKMQYTALNGSQ